MDGARVLNSCISLGVQPHDYVTNIDMLNTCLSKGIGAPFGSILLGNQDLITQAKIYRKWYGGCLHQSGLMAAIALNKIKNWRKILEIDNENASLLAELIKDDINILFKVETNIVMIAADNDILFLKELEAENIKAVICKPGVIRFVVSSMVNSHDINHVAKQIIRIHNSQKRS